RAALAALEEPPRAAAPPAPPAAAPSAAQPGAETRAALWEHAGLERDRAGLERLCADPYPLARLIAASALARQESRGAHRRSDFPKLDERLDLQHTVTRAG